MRRSKVWKLTPKYCGVFLIISKIREVAYKFQLPAEAKMHPVIHVSQLKKHTVPTAMVVASFPPVGPQSQFSLALLKVLDTRIVNRNIAAAGQWLV